MSKKSAGPLAGPKTERSVPAAPAPPARQTTNLPTDTVGAFEAAPRVDQVIEGLALVLLTYLPLAFGGVLPFSHAVLIATAGVIAALFAVRCFVEQGAAFVWSWGYVPAAAFVALVALQVTPLPIGLIELVSPHTAEIWRTAATDAALSGLATEPVTWATLSLYPAGTWTDLRVLLASLTIFFVLTSIYREKAAFRRLLAGAGLIGMLVATIGVVQLLLGADKIYWTFDSPVRVITAGPFASYSHYSEFLNLCLGCTLGYLLVRAMDRSHGRPIELRDLIDLRPTDGMWLDRALMMFLVLGALAIALSTSRNGLISLFFAGAVTAIAMQLTRKVDGVGWPMVGLAGVAFLALLALGFDPIYERMSTTMDDPIEAYGVRADLARDTFRMATALPLLGAGFGTYWVSFPMFDTSVRGGTAANAENQYLEFLGETGFLGGLCVLVGLGLVIAALVRLSSQSRSRTNIAGFGLMYGVAAIAFHSTTDFGLEIPAVGLLTCVVAAAAFSRASRTVTLATRPRFIAGGVAVALAGALALSIQPTMAQHTTQTATFVREALHRKMAPPNFRGTP
ncbi:MAG: O-antigen ligase family protein, partial [Planctomycetota bacterium]